MKAMGICPLFFRELRHRPGGFWIGALAIAVSVAAVIGARQALERHDAETEARAAALEEDTAKRMAELRNEARLFSRHLGFDTTILPPGQDPQPYLVEHRSTEFFTMEEARRLADRQPATINHLLPVLRGKTTWPTPGRESKPELDVVLVGIVGQIYIAQPQWQSPMQEEIEPGHAVIGREVAEATGAEVGDVLEKDGHRLTVTRVQNRRGNTDDVMIMTHLDDAQALLNLPGRVSAIMALSCACPVNPDNPFPTIELELARLLPGARILGNTITAEARNRARKAVAEAGRAQLASMKESREESREQLHLLARGLSGFALLGAAVTVTALSALNARERRGEAALLQALGTSPGAILLLLSGRPLITGFVGGLLGMIAVTLIATFGQTFPPPRGVLLFTPPLIAAALAFVAGALPALRLAGRDPVRELAGE
ncbi:MAG: FtsX-like permease family protein [Opitutales bacterium]